MQTPDNGPNSGHSHQLPGEVGSAEARARKYLAEGRWRKARDEIKSILKYNPALYKPLLIEANIGLARQMLMKGQVSEAKEVLGYLRSIASPEQLCALELEFSRANGKDKIATTAVESALDMLVGGKGAKLTDSELTRIADQVILSFALPEVVPPGTMAVAAEARAVLDALQAICSCAWSKASEVLRIVPYSSPFSHWVLFLKAVMAFHNDDFKRAGELFSKVPAGSLPGKASRVYRLLMGQEKLPTIPNPSSQAILDAALRLRGERIVGEIFEADNLWREGRFTASYELVRKTVPDFPTESANWCGAVTRFYFNEPLRMKPPGHEAVMRFFESMLDETGRTKQIERLLAARTLGLAVASGRAMLDLVDTWLEFIETYRELHGDDPDLLSMAYEWLGVQLARPPFTIFSFFTRDNMENAAGAVESLQESIRLNPTNLSARLCLAEVYARLRLKSQRNQLIDDTAAMFPTDKGVLLLAASSCFDRKSYKKGLGYLERARAIDKLDPAIPKLMADGYCGLALGYFKRKKPDLARRVLESLEALSVDNKDDFELSRWTVRLRAGVMEYLLGDRQRADALLADAETMSPCSAACHLFAHLAYRAFGKATSQQSPFTGKLRSALNRGIALRDGTTLLRIFNYWLEKEEIRDLSAEGKVLSESLRASLVRPFAVSEAEELFSLAERHSQFDLLALQIADRIMQLDPKHPRFRLFKLMEGGYMSLSQEALENELNSIVEEALLRHDDSTAQRASQALRRIQVNPPSQFRDYADTEQAFSEEAENFTETPDSDEASDWVDEALLLDELLKFMRALASSSKEEKENGSKEAEDVPGSLMDAVVDSANGPATREDGHAPDNTPKSSRPRRKSPEDPNQLSLF